MTPCPTCDGTRWTPMTNGMQRCRMCDPDPAPLVCRGAECLEPFRCNMARACALPRPEAKASVWKTLEPGAQVLVTTDEPHRVRKAIHNFMHTRRQPNNTTSVHYRTWVFPEGLVVRRIR